ncbi:hypothetical protein DACRYDRAFT_19664 [Dacryopinax primogenitus]|uniref:Uncharacterized protein n=1 Tax=Dacryopinax primogenitus (strain DJM 731) TaxID=1858805 RepID=M5GH37_DACPD|nr:uncharacterized protein DACRYDRAFT_19664 [Dacryopinax primogenitus]EJU06558.1 hypothetical protein DACRYDRAFT_19664 [Dacryopinax primogenitus]
MPTKYRAKDLTFDTAITRPLSPTPPKENSTRSSPPTVPGPRPSLAAPTSSMRSTAQEDEPPTTPPPFEPIPATRPASNTVDAHAVIASVTREPAPPAERDDPPPYSAIRRMPQSRSERKHWMLQTLYNRIDGLSFNLPGPVFPKINRDSFIRQGRADLVEGRTINDIGNTIFSHCRTWNASRCNVRLPADFNPLARTVKCEVISDSDLFESPTHLLVLTSGTGRFKSTTQIPVHELLYLAQCHNFKSGLFPPSQPKRVQEEDGTYSVTLPVITLSVPANHCFGLLDDYLYHRNVTYFFQQLASPLMPTPNEAVEFETNFQRRQYYVRLLVQHFSFPQLVRRLLAIHHLHQDAESIGVVDVSFWRVVNVSWFCVGAALKGKKNQMARLQESRLVSGRGVSGRSYSMPQVQS